MPSNSINVIDFNRNQLPRRQKFKNGLGGYNSKKKPEYNFPKATPKLLREIRQKLREENQILWIKIIALTIIIVSVLIWWLI